PRRAATERRLHSPVHHDALALGEPAAEVGQLVEPDQEQQAVGVAQHDLEDGAAATAGTTLADVGHLPGGRGLLAHVEARERTERAPILVAKREMVEHVLDATEAEAGELGGALRAYAVDGVDGTRQALEGGGQRRGRRPVV